MQIFVLLINLIIKPHMQCVVLVIKLIIALARTSRSTCKCVVLLMKAVFSCAGTKTIPQRVSVQT